MKPEPFEQWAIVELFGHARIAGKVTEQTIGGCSFIRVDVPATGDLQGYTKLYGNGAIYSIGFVDEETAMAAAASMHQQPIDAWSAREMLAALPAPKAAEPEDAGEFVCGDEDEDESS